MSDNITLPRKHIDYAAHALEHFNKDAPDPLVSEIIHHLRTALAAEPTKQEPSDDRKAMKEALRILTKPESGDLRWQVSDACDILRTALRTALAAPRLEVTVDPRMTPDEAAAISSALAAPRPEPEPVRHPGYVIGNHWLETAYERLCAGEAEDAILEDYDLVREPRLRELRRDAERYRWLRERAWFQFEFDGRYGDSGETVQELDAAIDAAMGDKT